MNPNTSLRNYLHGEIMTGMITFGQKTSGESLIALVIRAEGLNLPGTVVCIPAAAVIINAITAADRGPNPHRITASPSAVRQILSTEGVHVSALEVRHAAGYLTAMLEDIHARTDIKTMPTQLPLDRRLATYGIAARELTRVAARLLPEQRAALIQLWERCPDPENVQLLLMAATLSGETAAGVRTLPRWQELKTMATEHQVYIVGLWLRAATAHLMPGTPVSVPPMPGCGCPSMCERHTSILSWLATQISGCGSDPAKVAAGLSSIPETELLHLLYTAAHFHAATLAPVTTPA